jgi:type IV secretory pathway VirB6-like protein
LILDRGRGVRYHQRTLIGAHQSGAPKFNNTVDARLRNRGWLKLGLSVLILFVGATLMAIIKFRAADPRHLGQNFQLLGALVTLTVIMFAIWGNIDLANAKGHGSELVAVLVVLCLVILVVFAFFLSTIFAMLFLPALVIGVPLFILLGLEDKTRRGRHGRH